MWVVNGIEGLSAAPPAGAGSQSGPVLLIGSAACVWEDAAQWRNQGWPVAAVNRIGIDWPGELAHWCSWHHELLPLWAMVRSPYMDNGRLCRGPMQTQFHSTRPVPGGNSTAWSFRLKRGNSTMFALMVLLALGYEKVIMAGCPHDASGYYFRAPWVPRVDYGVQAGRETWCEAAATFFQDRVRSMSGWTRELLGEPDTEWLHG